MTHAITEIDVLWITTGLGCDGESVAITAATQPSIEDIALGGLPGLPKVNFYNPFMKAVIAAAINNPWLAPLEDQAVLALSELASKGDRLAFTTDTYVVHPLFFPGGDIGKLAVNETINDLATSGALPLHLSCGMVLEEGLPVETLRQWPQACGKPLTTLASQLSLVTPRWLNAVCRQTLH
jgi:hypothetical protein